MSYKTLSSHSDDWMTLVIAVGSGLTTVKNLVESGGNAWTLDPSGESILNYLVRCWDELPEVDLILRYLVVDLSKDPHAQFDTYSLLFETAGTGNINAFAYLFACCKTMVDPSAEFATYELEGHAAYFLDRPQLFYTLTGIHAPDSESSSDESIGSYSSSSSSYDADLDISNADALLQSKNVTSADRLRFYGFDPRPATA